jgi:hypothetical protein
MPLTFEADEIGKRYSVFYLLGSVASAFSGILAYGVRLSLSLSLSLPSLL